MRRIRRESIVLGTLLLPLIVAAGCASTDAHGVESDQVADLASPAQALREQGVVASEHLHLEPEALLDDLEKFMREP